MATEVLTREERAYHDACGRVEELLDGGRALAQVNVAIDHRVLSVDAREALKLYAWAWAETREGHR